MTSPAYDRQVFLNCPFDSEYQAIREAITFTVFDCGFRPRSALDFEDASQVRIDKIFDIVRDCRLGIHDIVELGLSRDDLTYIDFNWCASEWLKGNPW